MIKIMDGLVGEGVVRHIGKQHVLASLVAPVGRKGQMPIFPSSLQHVFWCKAVRDGGSSRDLAF